MSKRCDGCRYSSLNWRGHLVCEVKLPPWLTCELGNLAAHFRDEIERYVSPHESCIFWQENAETFTRSSNV